MKLLLVLSLLAVTLAAPNLMSYLKDTVNTGNESKEKMDREDKEKLAEIWGIDVDERKSRLNKLGEIFYGMLADEQKSKVGAKLKQITAVKIEKPNVVESIDLFEINDKSGVAEYLFQGDIFLTERQLTALEESMTVAAANGRSKRQATTIYNKWPNNTVHFYFDSSLNDRKRKSVYEATKYLHDHTCIDFVESSTATNRIRVYNGIGCFSSIGMDTGVQDLSIGDGCEIMGTVAHEFTHALGFWHTQMRSDRNRYVTVDLSHVSTVYHDNFLKLNDDENALYVPYEYGSFMHYPANGFVNTSNSFSIIPHDEKYMLTMGTRQISFYDIKMINDFYQCSGKCDAARSAKCLNGGVPNPRNCAVCNCPNGYGGSLCDRRPNGCGATLSATSEWKTEKIRIGDERSSEMRDVFSLCHHWIEAPSGYQIEVKITDMLNPQCNYGCPFAGIEIKGESQKEVTNPRICCREFKDVVYQSSLNPTPVISFNRYYYSEFSIQYRAVPSSNPLPATISIPSKSPATSQKPTTRSSSPCRDMINKKICVEQALAGFCTNPFYSFQTRKWNCGRTCGLCGKAADPCVDQYDRCDLIKKYGDCEALDPMDAEYNCAKTCGFCQNPN